jgi:hypothetical protein
VSTIKELRGRNSSGSGLENKEYGLGDPLRWPREILCPQKLALISPTCGGLSGGIVRLRPKTTELVLSPYKFYMSCPKIYPNNIWRREGILKLLFMQLSTSFCSFLSNPNILHSIPIWSTMNLWNMLGPHVCFHVCIIWDRPSI